MLHLPELTFASALLAGFISSGHCIAMCGGIALAGHSAGSNPGQIFAYHAGRLFSYGLIGALAGGTAGMLLTQACSDEIMATWPRMAANIALISIALAMLFGWRGLEQLGRPLLPLWHKLMPFAQSLRQRQDLPARFTLGMLWGWIPCGLVYAVAAAAAISGSASTGASLLLGFGIGTLPALLGGSVLMGNSLKNLFGKAITRPILALSILCMSVWQLAAQAAAIT